MKNYKCSVCGIGEMVPTVISQYQARLEGISFEVSNARINRCSSCDEISIGAAELKRWKKIQKQKKENTK